MYTAKTLAIAADTEGNRSDSYGEIGTAAFGTGGTVAVGGLFYCEIIAALIMFLSLGGNTLHLLVPDISIMSCTLIVSACIFPTVLVRNLQLLSRLSAVGIFASTVLIVNIIYTGVTKESGNIPAQGTAFFHGDTFLLTIG